jgi:hypothetical protein
MAARILAAAARAAALVGLGALLALAAPQAPAVAAPSEVYVEVNPSTVEAGGRVSIRASCPDNGRSATVRSDAFGRVTVEPRDTFLIRTVTVPADQDPRSFTVRLTCPDGETATATLHVVARDRPTRGPATGFGGAVGDEGAGGAIVAIGLLTVAAGLVLGVVAMRRRTVG